MSPPNASLILIMVCFWLTFWMVHRFLIKPVWGVLSERARRIEAAQRAWKGKNEEYLSATTRLESEMDEAARQGARLRDERRKQALEARQRRIGEAKAAAEESLRVGLEQLAGEADTARSELRERAGGLARLLAGQLLGREVSL